MAGGIWLRKCAFINGCGSFFKIAAELKLAMIDMYNQALDERENNKRFVIDHGLLVRFCKPKAVIHR